jgi:multidrug efflux pump subunit AcrA (membrane-fusion protein)
MILCGTTPRALGWRGALLVFGLGGLLLPALPAWGQDKKADEKRIEIEGIPLHLKIADLRLESVTDDVKKLQDEIARKRKELEAYEAKLKALLEKARAEKDQAAAKAALEKLTRELQVQVERTKGAAGDRWLVVGDGKEGVIHLRLVPKDAKAGSPVVELIISKKDGKWVVQEVRRRERKDDGKGGPETSKELRFWLESKDERGVTPRPKAEADARLERLEKVIQSLQAEVEALRRELKREGRPGAGPTPKTRPNEPRTEKPVEEGRFKIRIDELKKALDKGEKKIDAKLEAEIAALRAKLAELEKARRANPEPPAPPAPPRPRQ